MSDETDTDVDDLLSWKQHPYTAKLVRQEREALATLQKQLFRAAESSSDPLVRHAAIAYRTTEQFIELLEGKKS